MRKISSGTGLLAVAAVAGLTFFGCDRGYDNDDNETTTTDEYGATQTPGGVTNDTNTNLDMDAGADDSGIKDRITAQLANDPRFEDVDIDIDDGIVTIDGQVQNQADLDAVQQVVRQVQGVRDVKLDVDIESDMNVGK